MPWEKRYDEADVLERAMRAFWARGYEGTSMADLVAATGINRGSIYAAFTDKRGLFMRALLHYDEALRADFRDRLIADHPPREAIMKAFAEAACRSGETPPGCLVVNTALELSPHDPEIAALVRASLNKVQAFFEDMLEAAQASGTASSRLSVPQTASALLSLFLGLRVMSRAATDADGADAVLAQVEQMLG